MKEHPQQEPEQSLNISDALLENIQIAGIAGHDLKVTQIQNQHIYKQIVSETQELPKTEALEEELLDRYLSWLVEHNRELELPSLPRRKYHPVELDTVYVALRGDLSNPHERAQSQAMLEQQARLIENLLTEK
ncbi:hypothetical protein, partial [Spirulina sp. 06S082]|uniref:hypothetical protein n=1 Tax=Spirulina sp. 06S082 TaxID=3110248 RepID=UPI002B20C659